MGLGFGCFRAPDDGCQSRPPQRPFSSSASAHVPGWGPHSPLPLGGRLRSHRSRGGRRRPPSVRGDCEQRIRRSVATGARVATDGQSRQAGMGTQRQRNAGQQRRHSSSTLP